MKVGPVVARAIRAVDEAEFEAVRGEKAVTCSTPGCGRAARSRRRRLCPRCHAREYRKDPTAAERSREMARKWKREHLGQPGLPAGPR